MGGIWVHGELAGDGSLARISTEVATIARALGDESGEPVTGVVVGSAPGAAAAELARYVPRVIAIVGVRDRGQRRWDHRGAPPGRSRRASTSRWSCSPERGPRGATSPASSPR